ncbi:MAG: glycosyl hydrolase family 57 [Ruminococcaceae bacterium]|nr:glycosyl hydrolase family 57 [Oscillospiraceae bacterium]
MKENKIHVAYGFHVNCYHSYRGDTNDNLGFGSDIRIIRKILDILTDFNEKGIPVKGTWDTENFFSLQKILPEYAPDIIEKMKERVDKYGDENIIMGYNNGALSAMTEDEFCESINLALTNESGSGLMDIFGKCEKIVRPQEVMFTPSQVSLYNKLGIKALCLYYSCVPFDAFRTIIPRLPDELAFNPLTYTYKGESMTVIPTYSNSDVCDAGCLRAWVKELRKKQESSEINSDLFIFINMDADGAFWETINLGPVTGKVANTDGIHGLVEEIADLPYIVFDTPGGYLKNHKALGEIDFTHDTADGNFTGYASWSEKPFNRKIWTRLEKARAMAKVTSKRDMLSPSFRNRVLLLSTTHFGLATPVLNIQREKTALDLSSAVIKDETAAMPKSEKLTVYNTADSLIQTVQLEINKNVSDLSQMTVKAKNLESFTSVPTADDLSSVFLMMKFGRKAKKYEIEIGFDGEKKAPEFRNLLETDRLSMMFTNGGNLSFVQSDGRIIGHDEFLQSFITYYGKDYKFTKTDVSPLSVGGEGRGIRIKGEIHLPKEIKGGSFTYDFFTTAFSDAIYVRTTVNYPYTAETTSISTENSALGRFSDMKWSQAVPFQITPELDGDISVIKRNFMDDISSFRTQSFPECDEKNTSLASFNHQLTSGLVGLYDERGGIIIANARQVLGSMAHCPMRLEENKTVRMNPFGTYYGKQRHHFGRAKDQILGVYTLVTPQGKSIAPSYNGSCETAVLGIYPLSADGLTDEERLEICAFADGAVATAPEGSEVAPFTKDNISVREGTADGINEKDLKSPVLTGLSGNLSKYITKGSRAIGHIILTQIKAR